MSVQSNADAGRPGDADAFQAQFTGRVRAVKKRREFQRVLLPGVEPFGDHLPQAAGSRLAELAGVKLRRLAVNGDAVPARTGRRFAE